MFLHFRETALIMMTGGALLACLGSSLVLSLWVIRCIGRKAARRLDPNTELVVFVTILLGWPLLIPGLMLVAAFPSTRTWPFRVFDWLTHGGPQTMQ
jgi:hypothetical protein